jgi:hypothetical protein
LIFDHLPLSAGYWVAYIPVACSTGAARRFTTSGKFSTFPETCFLHQESPKLHVFGVCLKGSPSTWSFGSGNQRARMGSPSKKVLFRRGNPFLTRPVLGKIFGYAFLLPHHILTASASTPPPPRSEADEDSGGRSTGRLRETGRAGANSK